jgi:ribosome-associated toxin RatA of RatAB toxin-antitoxin module
MNQERQAVTTPEIHHVEHTVSVSASPERVFGLLREVSLWPQIFPPTVHAEYLERQPASERLQLWARANDAVRTWTSHRRLSFDELRISFAQERPAPPVASMAGEWSLRCADGGTTAVLLTHDFSVVDDDPSSLQWLREATDRNSRAELAALKAVAELEGPDEEATSSFEDSITVRAPAELVYRFLHEADQWPSRLPHVASCRVSSPGENVQELVMETIAPDGSHHGTRSFRVCRPSSYIAYKQVEMPALMRSHTGMWTVQESGGTVLVTSRHTVSIDRSAIEGVLGASATTASAMGIVRSALSQNSRRTLEAARRWAEDQVHAGASSAKPSRA